MKILDKFIKRVPEPKKKSYSSANWVSLNNGFGNEATSTYATSFAYTCLTVRAENLAKADIYLYSKKGRKVKEIEEHPFFDIINGVNTYQQTFYEILYSISLNLDIYGNAYVYYTKNTVNKPAALYVLPTNKVQIIYSSDKTRVIGYSYRSGDNLITYGVDEVIHFRLPSLENPYQGTPTISCLKHAINIDNLQQLYQENYYNNDASVGAILETDEVLSDDVFERLSNQWNERHSGVGNARKTAILEGGVKLHEFRGSPKESDYNQSRIDIRNEILAKLRVSPTVLGITEGVTRANAVVGIMNFVNTVIKPFSRFIVDKFNIFLKQNYDPSLYLVFDYEDFDDGNFNIEMTKALLDRQALTKNEARELFDYEPLPEDSFYEGKPDTSQTILATTVNDGDNNNNTTSKV